MVFWPTGVEAEVGAAVNCGWSQREGTSQTGSLLHVEVCDDASALMATLSATLANADAVAAKTWDPNQIVAVRGMSGTLIPCGFSGRQMKQMTGKSDYPECSYTDSILLLDNFVEAEFFSQFILRLETLS